MTCGPDAIIIAAMSEPTGTASSTSSPAPREDSRKPRKQLSLLQRAGFGLSGMLLVAGFFLPWLTAGTALELSGLGLVFSGGDMVQALSGSGRFLLFLIPLLGAALVFGAGSGHRLTSWAAAIGSGALLVFGLLHVIRVFLSSTGLGMWLVVFAALFALIIGLLSINRGQSK